MSQFLEACRAYSEAQEHPFTRISEICRGGNPETVELLPADYCLNVYSCAKTFTAAAIGILCDKGLLDTDQRVVDILADELPPVGMDERWNLTTVDMLLRHRAGLPKNFLDIDITPISEFSGDFLAHTFRCPLEETPGTVRSYSDGAYYLLARIAEKVVSMTLDSFLWPELFSKLDFQQAAWSHCPLGHVIGATGLYLNSSDLVKLAQVYLSGGLWKDRRILSESWVSRSLERGYGITYVQEAGYFVNGGMYGQILAGFINDGRAVAVQSHGGDTDALIRWILDLPTA